MQCGQCLEVTLGSVSGLQVSLLRIAVNALSRQAEFWTLNLYRGGVHMYRHRRQTTESGLSRLIITPNSIGPTPNVENQSLEIENLGVSGKPESEHRLRKKFETQFLWVFGRPDELKSAWNTAGRNSESDFQGSSENRNTGHRRMKKSTLPCKINF